MVRLMHSMVRANVLRRPRDWDLKVYGIPIPQVPAAAPAAPAAPAAAGGWRIIGRE